MAKQAVEETKLATVDIAPKILKVLNNYNRAFKSVDTAANEKI